MLAKELHSSILGTVIVDGISFGATFVVSKVSYDYFERRFLRLKRNLNMILNGYLASMHQARCLRNC